jgi:hypothetical protein
VRELAQLQELQQDRSLPQVRDDELGFGVRDAFHLDMQVGIPFALEFFAGEGESFVGGLDVTQGGAREHNAEERGHDRGDHGDVAHQRGERDAE